MSAVFTSMQQRVNCCTNSAAGTTSARLYAILGTVILAVSIFVLLLGELIIIQS